MMKKTYVSSQPEKLVEKSEKNILPLDNNTLRKEIEALMAKQDTEIDFSDIPELDFDKLGKPLVGEHYRPLKRSISIRLDSDVLGWFQSIPKYQTLINKICRLYYLKHQQHTDQKKGG